MFKNLQMINKELKAETKADSEQMSIVIPSSPNAAKPNVSSSQPEKDFVQWLTEDALPTTKDILAELRALNAKRDEAKQLLKDNNIEVTEDAIQQRVNGCC